MAVPMDALAKKPACGRGYEKSGALCYPQCRTGYKGVGPVCWKRCPKGYKNDGATCRKDVKIKKRPSYGRGAGKALNCAAGEDKDGALCYKACKNGYKGVGPVCWQRCPKGYKNDGATCRKPPKIIRKKSYGRGGGRALPCRGGRVKSGLLCYKKCKSGYKGVGPVCWQRCPDGFKNDGATCRRKGHILAKKSHGRGAGKPLRVCSGSQDKDGALCYPKCKAGYKGAGPRCWGKCPEGFKNDGATCRKPARIVGKKSYGRGAGKMLRRDYEGIFFRYIRDHHNMYYFRGKALTSTEKTELKKYYPASLVDKMRVAEELLSTGAFIHSASATTYGDNLIVINKKKAGNRTLSLLKHEMVHACQYHTLGRRGFAKRYADDYVDHSYDYNKMPIELDAFHYQGLAEADTPPIDTFTGSDGTTGHLYNKCK